MTGFLRRDRMLLRRLLRRRRRRRAQLRETEIEQLGARFRQNDVARLQVTVRHAVAVRFIEGVADLHAVVQHVA